MGTMCFSLCLRKGPLCPSLHCPFSPAISLCCKTQASVYYDEQLQERRKNRMVCFSRVQLFVTPWTVALQAPLSMGFSGKNTGLGYHFLLQDILTQGSNPHLPWLLHWQVGSLPLVPPGTPTSAVTSPLVPGFLPGDT